VRKWGSGRLGIGKLVAGRLVVVVVGVVGAVVLLMICGNESANLRICESANDALLSPPACCSTIRHSPFAIRHSLQASPGDVVINEVAWMGTAANDWDEWIELYNNTANTITLDGWTISFADGSPSTITLSGQIGPYGYFLLERVEKAVNDISADLVYGGLRMSNISETLTLRDNLGQVIDTVNADGGDWPAGNNNPDHSMERINPAASDTDTNWADNDGITRNGHDADGNPINGTPKCRNSAASPAADLALEKRGPTQASPGDRITYTIRLRNVGNITATAVHITDVLPAKLHFYTQTSPFTFTHPAPRILLWDAGNLPITLTYSIITLVVDVDRGASGVLTNVITATTAVTEATPGNNTASWPITVVITPGVALAPDRSGRALPGEMVTYLHTLTNTGNATDTFTLSLGGLPSGWNGAVVPAAVTLPVDTAALVTVTVTLPTDALSGTVGVAVLTATSGLDSSVFATVADTTTVGLAPGLSTLTPARKGQATPNTSAVYTHTLTNGANYTQTFHLTAASASGWGVTVSPGNAGPLAPFGGATVVTVTVDVPAGVPSGTVDVTVITATSMLSTAIVATTADTTTVVVSPGPLPANLSIAKSGPETVDPGAEITYTIRLSNTGDAPAADVVVTDTLPSGVSYQRQSSSYPFTQPTAGVLVWQIGTAPSGGVLISFTVTGLVADTASGELVNVVTAATTTSETTSADNTASHTTLVASPAEPLRANLSVAKSGPETVDPGAEITYTIRLSNTGGAPAADVVVTDTLPSGVTHLRQSSPYPFTQPTAGVLVWQIGTVPSGGVPISFTVTGLVTDTASGALVNVVTATTTTSETTTTDNTAHWTTTVSPGGQPQVLISALLYDGYQHRDYDEAVQLWNTGAVTASLSGWQVTDNSATMTFPDGATLGPGQYLWIARHALSFTLSFGFPPDYETNETDPAVPEMVGSWPGFANDGDECVLLDDQGHIVDALVYKGGDTGQSGWVGPALQPYQPTTTFREEGQILTRKRHSLTGQPLADTDTAADWMQSTAPGAKLYGPVDEGDIYGKRAVYPGWDLDTYWQPLQVTQTAHLTIAVAPDGLYEVIAAELSQAQESIYIEGYTFENLHLLGVLTDRLQAGVSVTVLLEGSPTGGMSDLERWACQRLVDAGGQVYFMYHAPDNDIYNRYRYQHAKLVIVDGEKVLIGSENFTYRAMPADDKADGTWGHRGVFLITDAPAVVSHTLRLFHADADPTRPDIVSWGSVPSYTVPVGYTPVPTTGGGVDYPAPFTVPLGISGTFAFELVRSPENSLRLEDGLLGLINRAGAGDVILVEQLTEQPYWGPTDSDAETDPNPRLEAYIEAARRGATVRILLDAYYDDPQNARSNTATRAYVNAIARAEGLDLEARLGNPTGLGIHNKMVLVRLHSNPGGDEWYVHVGSINGSETSHKLNRELALQVRSRAAYDYLAQVFAYDWGQATPPVYLPLILRGYVGPARHLLISEVLYDPSGADDLGREWVEIYNPTGQAVDLSGYKLGDAAEPGQYEGMYRFPDGAAIAPGQVIVVAQQAEDFHARYYAWPDYEIPIDPNRDDPNVPNLLRYDAWGSEGEFMLSNGGDEVLLLGPDDTPVDVVVYGAGSYPDVMPHPGVSDADHSLERYPAWRDTDDCARDFRDRTPPTPGMVPEHE